MKSTNDFLDQHTKPNSFASTQASMKIHSLFGLTVSLTSLCVVHTSVVANGAQDQTAIRPFGVPTVPQKDLDDLRRRVAATRWPEKETVGDQWREGLGSLRFFRQPPAPAPFAAF